MVSNRRSSTYLCLALAGVLSALSATLAEQKLGTTPDLSKAMWIWSSAKGLAGGGRVNYFRRKLDLPAKPVEATIVLTADNGYELYVNNRRIAAELGYSGSFWGSVERFRIERHLVEESNVIAIRGESLGGGAGVVAAVHIRMADGGSMDIVTDSSWLASAASNEHWAEPGHDDGNWKPAAVVARMGDKPWGMLSAPARLTDPKSLVVDRGRPGQLDPSLVGEVITPGKGFRWPEGMIFLKGAVPKSHHFAFPLPGPGRRTIRLRAYPENDVPGPAVLGRQMFSLVPAKPDGKLTLLLDAGGGTIGSPSVSYDGKEVYFSMAPEGEAFYHIYRMPVDGDAPEALTNGPFHDYDPELLPDGRIAFSSTRIGSREEYHGNLASSLFVMNTDGSAIQPLTYHIVADREPRVTASGSIVMIRSDNFLERAKVETQIHQMRLDGTGGLVLLGNDRGAIGYNRPLATEGPVRPSWLRRNGFGSPAPLLDGRVAAISKDGLVISGSGRGEGECIKTSARLFDISALPDGRLLCTTIDRRWLGVADPATGEVFGLYRSDKPDVHSAIYLGPRATPPRLAKAIASDDRSLGKTGYLYCQNVFNTKQTKADLSRIKAIRVYEGRPLALRPDQFPYEHIGVEAIELGTVPLAPDGSFYARVPADRALALQAVDGEGRAVINELSWIYVRPGERRSCIGCHASRFDAPVTSASGVASHARPADLLGQGRPYRFRGNNAEVGGVLNLQIERMREAAAIDLYPQEPVDGDGADGPLPPGRITEVKKLSGQLAAGDAHLKISSAQRLAIFRDRTAVPALVRTLADPNPEVRMNAALALSACGTRDAVPALLKALHDEDALVAQAANVALEHVTGHSVGFDAFRASERKREAMEWQSWLREHSWKVIEAELVNRLSDDDPQSVILAIEALGHVGGDSAKSALRSFITINMDKEAEAKSDLRAIMAAMRALGYLRDSGAVALLAGVLNGDLKKVDRRTVYLLATAAEALGWIGTPDAEKALVSACPKLDDFWRYTRACGDHPVLVANHSSVVHFRILEALDAIGTSSQEVVPALIRSVPSEQDRGLLLENDAYENLVGRVVRRSGLTPVLLETCVSVLGDTAADPSETYLADVTASPLPEYYTKGPLEDLLKRPRNGLDFLPYDREMRAAQIASVICLDTRFAPRLAAAFERYCAAEVQSEKEYGRARQRAWVCFYLARALGKVRHRGSVDALLAALDDGSEEARFGYRTPPYAMVYKAVTPFYRAAAVYALGGIGDRRAIPSLMKVVSDFDNALDVRHSAARALALLCDRSDLPTLRKLAEDYPEVATRRVLLEACQKAEKRSMHPNSRNVRQSVNRSGDVPG